MTKIGELEIEGSLQNSEVLSGLKAIETAIGKVGAKGSSIDSDFIRLDTSVTRVAKNFRNLGIVATTAIVGIAAGAPQVAGSIAQMGVQFDKLQRILGSELAPQFAEASDQFQRWVDLAERNKSVFSGVGQLILSTGEVIVSIAEKADLSLGANLETREGGKLEGEPLREDVDLINRGQGEGGIGGFLSGIPGNIMRFIDFARKSWDERQVLLNYEDLE